MSTADTNNSLDSASIARSYAPLSSPRERAISGIELSPTAANQNVQPLPPVIQLPDASSKISWKKVALVGLIVLIAIGLIVAGSLSQGIALKVCLLVLGYALFGLILYLALSRSQTTPKISVAPAVAPAVTPAPTEPSREEIIKNKLDQFAPMPPPQPSVPPLIDDNDWRWEELISKNSRDDYFKQYQPRHEQNETTDVMPTQPPEKQEPEQKQVDSSPQSHTQSPKEFNEEGLNASAATYSKGPTATTHFPYYPQPETNLDEQDLSNTPNTDNTAHPSSFFSQYLAHPTS